MKEIKSQKAWRIRNKSKCAEFKRKWRHKRYRAEPWYPKYENAKNRMRKGHHYYYRHLEFSITLEDVKAIWFRDKGWTLAKPSIDRINSNIGYTKDNIRIIELNDNLRRKKKKNEYRNRKYPR